MSTAELFSLLPIITLSSVILIIMMVIAVAFSEGIRWAERVAFPWRVGM